MTSNIINEKGAATQSATSPDSALLKAQKINRKKNLKIEVYTPKEARIIQEKQAT